MQTWMLVCNTVAVLFVNSPLHFDSTSTTIKLLRDSNYKIEGRDPGQVSGLLCALLPVNDDHDVHYVTLPNLRWNRAELILLNRFSNLEQIRAERDLDSKEWDTLKEILGDRQNLLLVYVRQPNGSRIWTGITESGALQIRK